jgi:Putative Ig domain/Regulator of chromosome condensation (RCC1) repeat/Fibronectin type III domain
VDRAGAAYCWGFNLYGQLGDGKATDSLVPVAVDTSGVLAGKSLTDITAGEYHTCALASTGAAYCWGNNGQGALGDGVFGGTSTVPVAVDTSGVLAGKSLTQIGAEDSPGECALDSAGAVYCWGYNFNGQLGDNSTNPSDVPVLTGPGAPTAVTALPGDASATVSWTAPASLDGGNVISYTATATPGGETCTTSATTCTIAGLTNNTRYDIVVVVHTSVGDSGSSASASVTPAGRRGLAFTSAASDTVTFGHAFTFTVTTSGSPVPKIIRTGRLPDGVTFTRNGDGTGTLSGTPTASAAGSFPMILTATNKTATATQAFTLTVNRAPAVKKIGATTVAVGSAVNVAVSATGYPAPAFTETGPLPDLVSLTDHGDGTAVITGTPNVGDGGNYPITVTATNGSGSASQAFTLKVNETPVITSPTVALATAGSPFSFQVTATGFPAPKIRKAGKLPKGVTFSGSTGTFNGTPAAGDSGSYPITVTAKNSTGTVSQKLTITFTSSSFSRGPSH